MSEQQNHLIVSLEDGSQVYALFKIKKTDRDKAFEILQNYKKNNIDYNDQGFLDELEDNNVEVEIIHEDESWDF